MSATRVMTEFNNKFSVLQHPAGCRFWYYPVAGPLAENFPPVEVVNRTDAVIDEAGQVVVYLEGKAGYFHASHLEPDAIHQDPKKHAAWIRNFEVLGGESYLNVTLVIIDDDYHTGGPYLVIPYVDLGEGRLHARFDLEDQEILAECHSIPEVLREIRAHTEWDLVSTVEYSDGGGEVFVTDLTCNHDDEYPRRPSQVATSKAGVARFLLVGHGPKG